MEPMSGMPSDASSWVDLWPWVAGGGSGLVVVVLVLAFVFWWLRTRPSLPSDNTPRLEGPVAEPAPVAPPTVLSRLRDALARTREGLGARFDGVLGRPLDAAAVAELEEALLSADVGTTTTQRLLARLRSAAPAGATAVETLRDALRDEMRAILTSVHAPLRPPIETPWIILVVGVNGSGKTTTIGKLASRFRNEGRKVLLAAGDTFRAAAGDQLSVWAERAGAEIVMHADGADPGAVVFDALQAAAARGCDTVIIDTAGRLQTKKPLMEQLAKLRRVIAKVNPHGPHETLLVVDGTTGQNALQQAAVFNEATPLTGVVVTKLDGTAKGGMVLTLANELRLPVKLIGIGERAEDLRDFDPSEFVAALL